MKDIEFLEGKKKGYHLFSQPAVLAVLVSMAYAGLAVPSLLINALFLRADNL